MAGNPWTATGAARVAGPVFIQEPATGSSGPSTRGTLTLLAVALLFVPSVAVQAADSNGWGTIRGQITYPGEPPKREPLNVDKDKEHCLEKGDLLSERWVVNPKNKGLRWAMVFLKPEGSQQLPVHPSLKEPSNKEVVVDQPMCAFEPHLVGIRADQTLVAKNSSSISHNLVIAGFLNDKNVTIPPGKDMQLSLEPENNAIKFSCGMHLWMTGYCWCFKHPYFAVTDENGNFEIKNAPAGKWNLAVWHETGYSGGREGVKGTPIDVKAGAVTDLGKVEFKVVNK
jgi:hypothetical protein